MNKPTSLYIHIPFCDHICDYCDFTKLQYFRMFAVNYLKALKQEIDSYHIGELKTIYVGGGTPTALEDDLFLELLEIIKPYTKGAIEYTFEANPESLSENKINMMVKYGVNRVSIGVQSTNDEILKHINRKHTFSDVKKAIQLLHDKGLHNINVDLILGLPHTSDKYLIEDLNNIIALNISHVSCYSLTIHPHTVLYSKGFKELDDDAMRHYYDIVQRFLSSDNFIHYEVSNWAKEGKESLHNLTYWKNEQYYGVGLGASGYIGDIRYKNTINLTKYLKGDFLEEKESVSKKDKFVYDVMLNLRTIFGLDLNRVLKEYGIDLLKTKEKEILAMMKEDYLFCKNGCLCPTYKGMMILDTIILQLI